MMRCPQCQTDNPSGSKYCNQCGSALDTQSFRSILPNPLDPSSALCDSSAQTVKLPVQDNDVANQDTVPLSACDPDVEKTVKIPLADKQALEPHSKQPLISAQDACSDNEQATAKRPYRKSVVIMLIVVLLGAVIAGVTYYFELWGGLRVPDVSGLSQEQATTILQEHGFCVRAMEVKSDDTEGKVILTDPLGNERARKGSEIVIYIAVARTIPDIVGKTLEEAKQLLEESGYTNIEFQTIKSDESDNTILEVSPQSGTQAKSTESVFVSVSQAYTVPDVVGMSSDEAVYAVEEAGYIAQIAYVYSESTEQGQVMSTSPEANLVLHSGSTVIVKVAKSRSLELLELTEQILSPGAEVSISGTNYLVHSLDDCSFAGNNTVSFTLTGQAFAILDGEKVYGSVKSVSAAAHFDSSNNYNLY